MLVSRTFVIEAVLRAAESTFDPASMMSNKLSPVRVLVELLQYNFKTEIGVVQQTHIDLDSLEGYHANKSFPRSPSHCPRPIIHR